MLFLRSEFVSPDDKTDLKLSFASLVYFIAQALNLTIKTALPVPEGIWGEISAFFGVVILFFFFRAWLPLMQRSKGLVAKSYLFFLVVFVLSALLITIRNEPLTVLKDPYLVDVFVFWLPTGLCAAAVYNKQILYDAFFKTSYFLVVLGILCFLGGKVSGDNENVNAYNMQLGFTLIIPTLFFLNEVFKGRYKFLVLFGLQMAIIIAYANRGVLLSVLFFAFYKVFIDKGDVVFSFITIASCVLLIVFMEPIALFLSELLAKYNLSSRTLMLVLENSIQESSGRDEIWTICNEMLVDHPITGYGLGGECFQIYHRMRDSGAFSYAFSPHNGILQFILQFGWILGLLACFLMLLPIFRMHRIGDVYRKDLILIFCSAVIIPCCYSAGDIFLKPASAIYFFVYYFDVLRIKKQI